MAAQPWTLAIDFGTSFTVAVARIDGRSPEVIEVAGERRVPSVILAEDADHIVVGRVAEELSATHPHSTLRAPKSRLGDQAPVVLAGRPYQVVQLVAALMAYVYEEAVRHVGGPPQEVRLTHPATWNRPSLNRLIEAAAKAGLPNPVLVPEPVAAALSYASEAGVRVGERVVVYDLGGGTFDTAVVEATDDGFVVVGRPGGDPSIGGELFDEMLVNEIGARLDPAAWEAVQVAADPAWQRVAASLRNEARRAKETLSAHAYADVLLPLPSGMSQQRLMREEFEELVRPYIEETVTLLDRCLVNAGLRPDDVKAIYLVGGASRIPLVEQLTAEAFPGVPVSRRGDPKMSVALGASLASTQATAAMDHVGPRSTEDAAAPTADQGLVLAPPPSVDPNVTPPPSVDPNVDPHATESRPSDSAAPATRGSLDTAAPVPPPPRTPPPPTPAPSPATAPTPPPATAPAPVAAQPLVTRQPVPTSPPPDGADNAPGSGSKRGVIIGIVAAVVLVALIVGLMVALAGGGGSGSGADTTDDTRAGTRTTAPSRTTEPTDTTDLDVTTTAVDGTVPPVSEEVLSSKLLTVDEVNSAVGEGFTESPPSEPGPLPCGLETIPTQVSAVRVFDNDVTGARVVSAIDRYPTLADARAAFDQEAGLATECAEREYLIDDVSYTVLVLPFGDGLSALESLGDREVIGLLLGYSRVIDPTTTTTAPDGYPSTIYQFVVETIDGPNVIGSSFITLDRELTEQEIAGYIQLFQTAVSRGVS